MHLGKQHLSREKHREIMRLRPDNRIPEVTGHLAEETGGIVPAPVGKSAGGPP